MYTHTTKAITVLRDDRLAHGGAEDGVPRLFDELCKLLVAMVADGAGIDENRDAWTGLLYKLHYLVDNEALYLLIVLGTVGNERNGKRRFGNLCVCDVGGQHEVDRTGLRDALGDDAVNLRCSGCRVIEV
jgi:hypothetical protein